MTAPRVIWESHLVGKLGVSRDDIREARKRFTEGTDWWLDGNRVVWRVESVDKLAGDVEIHGVDGVEVPKAESEPTLKIEPLKRRSTQFICNPEHVMDLRVLYRFPNPHFVAAILDGQRVSVRVRSNARFQRGMIVKACRVSDQLWESDGRPWVLPEGIVDGEKSSGGALCG